MDTMDYEQIDLARRLADALGWEPDTIEPLGDEHIAMDDGTYRYAVESYDVARWLDGDALTIEDRLDRFDDFVISVDLADPRPLVDDECLAEELHGLDGRVENVYRGKRARARDLLVALRGLVYVKAVEAGDDGSVSVTIRALSEYDDDMMRRLRDDPSAPITADEMNDDLDESVDIIAVEAAEHGYALDITRQEGWTITLVPVEAGAATKIAKRLAKTLGWADRLEGESCSALGALHILVDDGRTKYAVTVADAADWLDGDGPQIESLRERYESFCEAARMVDPRPFVDAGLVDAMGGLGGDPAAVYRPAE